MKHFEISLLVFMVLLLGFPIWCLYDGCTNPKYKPHHHSGIVVDMFIASPYQHEVRHGKVTEVVTEEAKYNLVIKTDSFGCLRFRDATPTEYYESRIGQRRCFDVSQHEIDCLNN